MWNRRERQQPCKFLVIERFEKKLTRFVPTINKTDSFSSILELVFCQNWIWMNGIVTKRSDHVLVQNRPLQSSKPFNCSLRKVNEVLIYTSWPIRQSKQNYCEGDRLNKTQLRTVWCSIFCFCINHTRNEFFNCIFDFQVMNVCWLFLYNSVHRFSKRAKTVFLKCCCLLFGETKALGYFCTLLKRELG